MGALPAQVVVVAPKREHAPHVEDEPGDAHDEHQAGGGGHVVGGRAVLLWVGVACGGCDG